MGDFLKIRCDCGKQQFFQIGVGFCSTFDEAVYKDIRENKMYPELREFVSTPNDISDAENRLYHCKNCGRLEEHIYFKIPSKPDYRLRFKCKNCSHVMKHVENAVPILTKRISVSCPECNNTDIVKADNTNVELGCWD